MKSANDLERMYDRKLRLEREKFMELEQKNIEQKIHYEKLIYELEKRYHEDIGRIREQYSSKMKEEFKRLQDNRRQDLEYKKKMEYKLIELEEQSDITMMELQKSKDDKIERLMIKIHKLE